MRDPKGRFIGRGRYRDLDSYLGSLGAPPPPKRRTRPGRAEFVARVRARVFEMADLFYRRHGRMPTRAERRGMYDKAIVLERRIDAAERERQ